MCPDSLKHPYSRLWKNVFAALLALFFLIALSATSLLAQSDSSSQSQAPPPDQQSTGEAGGPQGEVSPVVVPKKKEEPPPPPKPQLKNPEGMPTNFSIRVDVPEVTVPVTVTTKDGEFIPGLKQDNFRILEDGQPQQIRTFAQNADRPVTAVLLVEFASKNYQFMYDMLNNAYGFVNTLKPNDWVAVISYDMHTYIHQDFTQDKGAVIEALNRLRIPGFAETNLFDALYDTLDRLDRIQGHKYIVLIASGVDTFSKKNFDTVQKKIKATKDVTIFAVSTGFQYRALYEDALDPSRVMPGQTDRLDFLQADNEMKTYAALTGGTFYEPRFPGDVRDVMGEISNSIRNEYVLTYQPSNGKLDGTYRKIKVDLVNPDGSPINLHVNGKKAKFNIVARAGYTARHEVE